jgi:hypothetical protein
VTRDSLRGPWIAQSGLYDIGSNGVAGARSSGWAICPSFSSNGPRVVVSLSWIKIEEYDDETVEFTQQSVI